MGANNPEEVRACHRVPGQGRDCRRDLFGQHRRYRDRVKVDQAHYETEDARIYMAGPGPDAACQSGHKQSETLYCAGAFFYADL